ncbi:carbon-nitrogen family hydrolase [Staphylococcus caprae]
MKIKILQFEIQEADFEANIDMIKSLIRENYKNIDIIVLPEMWNFGYALTQLNELANEGLSKCYELISGLARQFNINIVAGSVANKTENGIFNTAFSVARNGTFLNENNKVHLVPMLDEPQFLTAGRTNPNCFKIEGTSVSQLICYDLRFPEVARQSVMEGSKVIFVVAQWTTKNLTHWKILLRARAVENHCFVVACNNVGRVNHPNHMTNTYAGHSMIVHPSGEVLIEANDEPQVIECEINIEEVDAQRENIPTLDIFNR